MWTPEILVKTALLAELGPWRNLVGAFRGEYQQSESSSLVSTILITALVVACFSSLVYLGIHQLLERRNRSTAKLFHDLCHAHGLDTADRRLLLSLAHAQKLADPAELFVAPERFDSASIGDNQTESASRLDDLRSQLFRGSAEDDSSADPGSIRNLAQAAARIEASTSWSHPKADE